MANKEHTNFENPYLGYAETATHTLREVWGWQMKATQSLFDQSLRAAQTYADFAQTQLQESVRLSSEIMKMNMATTEDLKKSFTTLTDKVQSAAKQ
jgi:hypothetical protein